MPFGVGTPQRVIDLIEAGKTYSEDSKQQRHFVVLTGISRCAPPGMRGTFDHRCILVRAEETNGVRYGRDCRAATPVAEPSRFQGPVRRWQNFSNSVLETASSLVKGENCHADEIVLYLGWSLGRVRITQIPRVGMSGWLTRPLAWQRHQKPP